MRDSKVLTIDEDDVVTRVGEGNVRVYQSKFMGAKGHGEANSLDNS